VHDQLSRTPQPEAKVIVVTKITYWRTRALPFEVERGHSGKDELLSLLIKATNKQWQSYASKLGEFFVQVTLILLHQRRYEWLR
jgi:hypothetical protein